MSINPISFFAIASTYAFQKEIRGTMFLPNFVYLEICLLDCLHLSSIHLRGFLLSIRRHDEFLVNVEAEVMFLQNQSSKCRHFWCHEQTTN